MTEIKLFDWFWTLSLKFHISDGQLYSATAADFSGGDALIYRDTQRTEQFNAKQLNQPSFVSTLERNGYVFFFFRELALENCGKTIYSRVARVCKNDRGGPSPFRERWTSYLKTRLNCSTPGDFPFYFDELRTLLSFSIFFFNFNFNFSYFAKVVENLKNQKIILWFLI